MYSSPSIATGGKIPGSAVDARIARISGPEENQCSSPVRRFVAETWSGTSVSSNMRTGSCSTSRRIPVFGWMWSPRETTFHARANRLPGKMSSVLRSRHTPAIRSVPSFVGSAATAAAFSAPTDVAISAPGRMPDAMRAWS